MNASITTLDDADLSVTYDDRVNELTEVPEPASLSLLVFGLAAAGWRLPRRGTPPSIPAGRRSRLYQATAAGRCGPPAGGAH